MLPQPSFALATAVAGRTLKSGREALRTSAMSSLVIAIPRSPKTTECDFRARLKGGSDAVRVAQYTFEI